MEVKLQLQDLYLGKIDAKHELQNNTDDERRRFIDSFLMPKNLLIQKFIDGENHFAYGLKGTGKTALLRYIAIKSEEILNAKTMFVLFKSNISESDRRDFQKAANTAIVSTGSDGFDEQDYEDVWKWFLHRQIVKASIADPEKAPFVNDRNWKKYATCILAANTENEDSGILRLFPKLRKGRMELTLTQEEIGGNLGLEFDWEDQGKSLVRFNSVVRQADELYSRLTKTGQFFYLFLDELEVSLGTSEQYERDIRLIRDLVVSIGKFNEMSKRSQFNVRLFGAIRTEVMNAVESAGKEINKIITDFGSHIVWDQSGGDINKHPILQIIVQKIAAAEKSYNLNLDISPEAIWNRYFQELIQEKSAPEFILHQTWYRPRDVIRLLNLAQNHSPESTKFTQKVFDATRKQYSNDSWHELREELKGTYSSDGVDAIKKIFTGMKSSFTYTELLDHISNIKELYKSVRLLVEEYSIGDILSDLYRVGIIGNSGVKMRFAFRGDDGLLLDKRITLHRALWSCFSIEHPRERSNVRKNEHISNL